MSEINVFEDEELVAETSTRGIGDVNWLSKTNLILGLITGGVWYAVPILRAVKSNTEYTITDQRIVEESGFISSSSTQTKFEKIVGDVTTNQSTSQVATDTGDVTFEIQKVRDKSASTGNIGDRDRSERQQSVNRQQIVLNGVKNHEQVAEAIRELQHNT